MTAGCGRCDNKIKQTHTRAHMNMYTTTTTTQKRIQHTKRPPDVDIENKNMYIRNNNNIETHTQHKTTNECGRRDKRK